ncbi:hypothetical protein EOM86_03530, partial [Candidatus Nomurabacteria bacterium]|nr:hypothetical protein [Candidatus Nomurabacteria bacterium]
MAYTEKSAREKYESALKRYRTGTKSQIDPSDMRSRYENLMTKYTQAPVPEQTVQSPQATPVQTQPDPEKRSFGEGAKEFGKAVSGSLGAGILNILRTTLAYAEKAASITLGDGDKSLSENIKDIVSGDRFKDDPDRSTIDKVSPFLSLLGPTSVINVARAMYKSATSETDVNNLIKPTEDKVREWADVENEILPVRIIAGAAGSAPQMLVTMLNPAIGVPILFNSAFQNNLEQYKAEGLDVSDGVVISRAVGSAAIESASEYMFNAWAGLKGATAGLKGAKGVKGAFLSGTKGFLDNFAREAAEKAYAPTVMNFIKFLLKQGVEEGTEELVSGIGSGLMALATTDRGGKFMSWDKEGKKNLKGEAITDEGAIVVMDLIEQFGAGFLMGMIGSTFKETSKFTNTRKLITKTLGDVDMSSVTEEDVKTVLETLKQDLKSPEAQKELAEKLARGVSKAESVYAEGMQVKNNQTGEVMTLSIAPEGDEITLTSPSGFKTVTHEEFDAMFEQNILTEASPAQTAVNGSDLLPGTPVSGGAVTQQESMTVEGKSRKESVTSYADKKGRPTSIKSYIAGKEAVVEIANPGSQVPAYIRFDPDEYSQAENRAMYLQEVSSRSKTPMSKIASKNAQTVSEFYSAITSATDDAVSTYI